MSDTDSFIDEVTEEVRRDRLFAMLRKYGWIGILLVLVLVGGAAYREWNITQNRNASQALGDALISAIGETNAAERMSALSAIEADADGAILVAFLNASAALDAGETETAYNLLRGIADNAAYSETYRDLATLKLAIAGSDLGIDERTELLLPIAVPGRPFRLLAEEQLAMIDVEKGDVETAISRLNRISSDSEASTGLRQRVSQVIVALGGTPE